MAYLTSGRDKIMGSSVSTDANVVTVIDESSTDEQVPSALATKAYVDNKEVKISTEENNKIEIKLKPYQIVSEIDRIISKVYFKED